MAIPINIARRKLGNAGAHGIFIGHRIQHQAIAPEIAGDGVERQQLHILIEVASRLTPSNRSNTCRIVITDGGVPTEPLGPQFAHLAAGAIELLVDGGNVLALGRK